MVKYRYLDHTGDLGVEVFGESLPVLFRHAGEAFTDIVSDATAVRARHSKRISLESEDLEALLVRFLNELVFLFESEGFLPKDFEIQSLDTGRMEATVQGDLYEENRHPIKTTIKGATYHQLRVARKEDHWQARIIFDL